jgi:hypothetical protein
MAKINPKRGKNEENSWFKDRNVFSRGLETSPGA